jgi:hypothetical protein
MPLSFDQHFGRWAYFGRKDALVDAHQTLFERFGKPPDTADVHGLAMRSRLWTMEGLKRTRSGRKQRWRRPRHRTRSCVPVQRQSAAKVQRQRALPLSDTPAGISASWRGF